MIYWGEHHLITWDKIYTFETETNKLSVDSLNTVLLPRPDTIHHTVSERLLPAIVMDYNKRLIHNKLSARYNQ
ncbi:hypothetical protein [Porphyromonas cangingivalis]|uniref:hypothetical protein n=1 Tax=Porphyromonas cangingivalis TaxID=36874 RepID=UPI00046F32BE|nr:hypothetical protein [Porphyromonas cangingivalis]